MKKITVICLLVITFFITGCFMRSKTITNLTGGHYWSDDEVNKLYESLTSVTDLQNYLIVNKFEWSSDGLNLTPFTDTFAEPNSTLTYRKANCSDYSHLFQKYIEHMASRGIKVADSTQQIYMRKGYPWHYVLLINVNGLYYMQSNTSLSIVSGYDEVKEIWYKKGYEYFDIVKTWRY